MDRTVCQMVEADVILWMGNCIYINVFHDQYRIANSDDFRRNDDPRSLEPRFSSFVTRNSRPTSLRRLTSCTTFVDVSRFARCASCSHVRGGGVCPLSVAPVSDAALFVLLCVGVHNLRSCPDVLQC